MKRAIDCIGSLVALIVLSPLLTIASIAIALESGRPVVFRQQRVGRNGQLFGMYKLRSMIPDAESVGPYFTSTNDPRVTRVGRILRRTSVDELPQLVNVLRGDMSLVGPRPDVLAQRSLYSDRDWELRCSVRPGITGLAQALYRSDSTLDERLEADLRYARESSLILDARILAWTLRRLSGRGTN